MRFKEFNWHAGTFLIGYHIVLLIVLPWYLSIRKPSTGIIVASVAMFLLTGFAVTAGFHRLYAHRSYRINKFAEIILLIFATLSVAGSILRWSHNHRLHHGFVDTDKDPYSIKKGFWYAHFIWMLKKQSNGFDPKVVPDLMRNKLIVFQDKYNVPLILLLNGLSIMLFGYLFNDYFGAFVFTFLLRMFLMHHSAFFVNSLAHTWGAQPYSHEHSAVNNWIIGLLTLGEGYHNYHHTFSSDYRNGIRWYQFDPTRLLIWLMSKMNLAHNLIKTDKYRIKEKLILQDRKLLFEKLRKISYIKWTAFEQKINDSSERLITKFNDMSTLIKNFKSFKAEKSSKSAIKDMKNKVKQLRKSIRDDMREWRKLCVNVLKLKPSLM